MNQAVISIAGFDPSGGAGVLSDIKTFEALDCIGFGVTTSLTFQNESDFEDVEWIELNKILRQIEIVVKNHKPTSAKIGLIENLTSLEGVVQTLKSINPEIQIIWDPIIGSSSGFGFHKNFVNLKPQLLSKLTLITPNWKEIMGFGTETELHVAEDLSRLTAVLLKGGHRSAQPGVDLLIRDAKALEFHPESILQFPKHGSGCVLSAAITGYLSRGLSLENAVEKGKKYISEFLESTTGLLGKHRFIEKYTLEK